MLQSNVTNQLLLLLLLRGVVIPEGLKNDFFLLHKLLVDSVKNIIQNF